ncbi:hypothetical protein CC78DRAFT_542034 [Lojkania enalia]|uniref:HIT-type domain-containing protein n=1 Tax=Lojkania enalia TaxID=147567 RepID=A0A9P4KIK7_9PLEO|nr:hypothetical protein CC78DRAFT_542034 [Didymosphaeria enalia]
MAERTLLSDLCSICNDAKFKYCCPGCSARTCSLQCYKKHQNWAQCSGKRDPTRFIKKSQLATPAGVDHDFNFLTSIERGMERAESDLIERGIAGTGAVQKGWRKGEIIDRRLDAIGVSVIRAPEGLSRHKENKTRKTKRGNLMWTVEWIHEDRPRLLSDVPASLPILQAYSSVISSLLPKKRKRIVGTPSANPSEARDVSTAQDKVNREPETEEENQERKSTASRRPNAKPDDVHVAEGPYTNPDCNGTGIESVHPKFQFYLLRPRTNSSRHVLIPISVTTTLNECLRGQTVLEYPTIHVLTGAPYQLPDKYILEEEYLKQESKDEQGMTSLLESIPAKTDDLGDGAGEIDSKKILDVLKKDLCGAL